ncbi:hypothetical protein [Candidatus Endomicrobiellum pyrsonymphae]
MWQYGKNGRMLRKEGGVENRFWDEKDVAGEVLVEEEVAVVV